MKSRLSPVLAIIFIVFIVCYGAMANEPPQAGFIYFPAHPDTLDTVQFLDTSSDPDGTITSWYWDFGDGEGSNIRNPAHRYADPGAYVVSLTVTDNEGASDIYSETITVTRPPAPRGNRFRLYLGMTPQGTQSESVKFDFDLEAYLDLSITRDKSVLSFEGITGIAGPELAILEIETPLGLVTLDDQWVFAAPFNADDQRLGGLRFVKKRFITRFDFVGFYLENLLLAENIHFSYPYSEPVQTPEYRFGDILTLRATTVGGIRLTSILGLCADPQLTNLLKKKGFRGRVCDGDFGFTVEKLVVKNITIGNLRLDSETEFRPEEPTAETLKIYLTLPGIGRLTAVLTTADILSFTLEQAILRLRSGTFTVTTVFDSSFSVTSNSLSVSMKLFNRMRLITTATFLPSTGLSSLMLYSLLPTDGNSRFKTTVIFSDGSWSSVTFTLSAAVIEGLKFDAVARFQPTGLDEVSFDLELML